MKSGSVSMQKFQLGYTGELPSVERRALLTITSYFGDWENTRLYPTSGAYHGTEMHMILGGSEDASGLPASEAQKQTFRLFQRAVAAFADNPRSGLVKLGWPQFNPNTKSWIEIAIGNNPRATFAQPEKYDKPCSTIIMGALPTLT